MVTRGERVVIGVCDLDGFKAVNTRHGHHSGDLVLQRVAGVINRVMRRGDFVARYGGDEFVVVLPDAGMPEAVEVARRIEAAIRTEDWESLVPGTPVGVTIGFAEVDGSTTRQRPGGARHRVRAGRPGDAARQGAATRELSGQEGPPVNAAPAAETARR